MNPWLITGACSAAFLAVAHSYLGERYILIPLLRADLSASLRREKFQKSILRFAWHLTSIAWLGFAFVIYGLNRPDATAFISAAVAVTFTVHAVITALSTRFRHLAWILFLVAAAG